MCVHIYYLTEEAEVFTVMVKLGALSCKWKFGFSHESLESLPSEQSRGVFPGEPYRIEDGAASQPGGFDFVIDYPTVINSSTRHTSTRCLKGLHTHKKNAVVSIIQWQREAERRWSLASFYTLCNVKYRSSPPRATTNLPGNCSDGRGGKQYEYFT